MKDDDEVILGIDYGLAYIGLAISTSGEIASPLAVIKVKNKSTKELAGLISQKFQGQKIAHLVVGVSEGEMAKQTKIWAHQLANVLQLPVEFIDETLSSVEAGSAKDNHAKSAAVILQRYLDNKNSF
mgnify:CR=1 FL=1